MMCHGNSVSSEENHMGGAGTAICLVMRAALPSGQRAGWTRRLGQVQAARASSGRSGVDAENTRLRDRDTIQLPVGQLVAAERGPKAAPIRKLNSLTGRSHLLWCIEYSGIPQR